MSNYSNYSNSLYKDYETEKLKRMENEKQNKFLKLTNDVLEYKIQILEKQALEKENKIEEKNKEINEIKKIVEAQNKKILELTKQLDLTKEERDKYFAKLNNDGTNSGIPTSQTPLNKIKVIPNSREKTGKSIGGQKNHPKSKLEKFNDEEINENKYFTLCECQYCHSKNLEKLNEEVCKDEFDYKIKIIKRRNHFPKYLCKNCNKVQKKDIPVNLKEENQYGSNVQATVLTLANIGNVSMNKIRKIISGLTISEIDLSEGYIAKLQRRAALKLDTFIEDLKFYIKRSKLIYWDDTVIMVNKKRSCMRFYGDELVALYFAHEQKNKAGLDEDGILNKLTSTSIVEHDHNRINYNEEYSFINIECCQHLLRDLEKVKTNIPKRTWCIKMKELFSKYDHLRKELINKGIDHFSDKELNDFLLNINDYLLIGVDEYLADQKAYYASEEKALLLRIMEFRDNYIYWTLDFDLPFTNNLSERALRGVKSKMKVAGQFQNITNAEYYAKIRSYIETANRNGINGHEALVRLINGNPYSLEEMLEVGKQNVKKSI